MNEPLAPPADTPRVLLIDLDNCPQQLSQLPDSLEGFTRIVVCYGSQEPKLPLGLVTALAEPILSGKLDIVGMKKKGKNAADFGLSFHAGRLMVEMPPETEFTLLSEDTDLDHAVNLLRDNQRSAHRVNGKIKKPPQPAENALLEVAAREYASHALRPNRPRPARQETLLNSIGAYIKNKHAVNPKSVLDWLTDKCLLEISATGKVRYLDAGPEIDEEYPLEYDDDIPF